MKTGSGYALLAAPALLALAACEIRDESDASGESTGDMSSEEAVIEEPAGDEIDPEALPPDYPPTDAAEPLPGDANGTTVSDEMPGEAIDADEPQADNETVPEGG